MSLNLHDELLTIARSAADHMNEVAKLNREITLLKGKLWNLTAEIERLCVENKLLRKGIVPASAGDSR